MSDENQNTTPPAAAPAATPSQPAATQPASPEPKVGEPEWLPKRLEQAKRSAEAEVLKALNVESLETAKARIAEAQKLADEKKSELERRDERIKALEPTAAEAARLKEMASRLAMGTMTTLTAEQQAAVKAIAGDDPAKQLETIEALKPTWAKAAPPATSAATPPPATTAPPPGAPNGAAPPTANARGAYEAMRQSNPFAAATFGMSNPDVYEPK